jgi:hypothetical protein
LFVLGGVKRSPLDGGFVSPQGIAIEGFTCFAVSDVEPALIRLPDVERYRAALYGGVVRYALKAAIPTVIVDPHYKQAGAVGARLNDPHFLKVLPLTSEKQHGDVVIVEMTEGLEVAGVSHRYGPKS